MQGKISAGDKKQQNTTNPSKLKAVYKTEIYLGVLVLVLFLSVLNNSDGFKNSQFEKYETKTHVKKHTNTKTNKTEIENMRAEVTTPGFEKLVNAQRQKLNLLQEKLQAIQTQISAKTSTTKTVLAKHTTQKSAIAHGVRKSKKSVNWVKK